MPTNKFPVEILQRGLKITTEPPTGLKSNIIRTYMDMSHEAFTACKNKYWKKFLLNLVVFHGVVQVTALVLQNNFCTGKTKIWSSGLQH